MLNKNHRFFALYFSFWLANESLLMSGGFIALLAGEGTLAQMATIFGFIMFFAGVSYFLLGLKSRNYESHTDDFIEGVFAMLLSLPLPVHKLHSFYPVVIIVTVWELFSGVLKLNDFAHAKEHKSKVWIAFLIIAVIEIVSSITTMIAAGPKGRATHELVATVFFTQAVGFAFKIYYLHFIARKKKAE